jgi:hypothetical protein
MTYGHRLLLKWARLVHVYVTMFGLLLILFFAVTGFMLNHEKWFGFEEKIETTTPGSVPTGMLVEPNKLAIVELLRKDFDVRGAMVGDFELQTEVNEKGEEKEYWAVKFKGPGREDAARIDRKTGQTVVKHETAGLVGLLVDLHRGRETGAVWSLVIDGLSVLLLIVSVTGLVMWQSLRGRARYGLVFMVLGLVVTAGVYYVFVP